MKSKGLIFILITGLSLAMLITLVPHSFGEESTLRTSQGKIFDGLHSNYTFETSVITLNAGFEYNYDSGDLYNVTWSSNFSGSVSWLENIETRITSNSIGGGFGDAVHTPMWVFTNLTIGNSTLISVDAEGDHLYNVISELIYLHPNYGILNLWVLQGVTYPSSVVWYEQSTGILINGTFIYSSGTYIMTLTDTNVFSHYQTGAEIPGYSLIIFIPLIFVSTVVMLRKLRRKLF
ncbi:MAG: hypothetical protein ACW986_16975 [Promethearchaeota archaeon]|jgi:hypothetical protein